MTFLQKEIRSAAKNRIAGDVISNMPLVLSIAKKYQGCGLDFDDLIQEGTIGLVIACEKFDISKNGAWGTYAYRYIDGYIRNALSEKSRLVRLPNNIASNKEAAEAAAVKVGALDSSYQGVQEPEVEQTFLSDEEIRIHKLLARLEDRDKLIVKMKFGIGYDEEQKTKDIAKQIGLSAQMVNARFRAALEKMKS